MRALSLLAVAVACVLASVGEARTEQPFVEWLEALIAEARGRGFGDELLAQTLAGLSPLPGVIAADRRQAESVLTFEEYLRRRVTPERVQRARDLRAEHRELLDRVRDAYGVPPAIVVSIWGLESRFGEHRGEIPVFQALATLAWEGRRAPFFRGQLYDALRMVDRGYIDAPSMKGSWAGAMGQPQFMTSTATVGATSGPRPPTRSRRSRTTSRSTGGVPASRGASRSRRRRRS
jgi:membrane-bound lytic murein transglycosylase B